MKQITANDPETRSADVLAENVEHLKTLFPEAFSEGKIDFDLLRQLFGAEVDEREEKYGLNWHGKRRARQLALTPSTGTLRPCQEESVHWDTTQNLMIEGDNLEVLKLLQKSYAGRVKLIYIDPPYNTGKDFVYPDDYRDNIRNYLRLTGQTDDENQKLSSNTDASGRFHTDWLNMMYPRLKLARNLLSDLGVLFVTVDDTECGNLRSLLDEIFGLENLCASIAWKKRSSPDARDTIGSVHDWILCYVKNSEKIKTAIGKLPLSKNRIRAYSNPDDDPRGEWASVDMTGMTGRATKDQYFDVILPSGRIIGPPKGRSWGLAEKTFDSLRSDNRIWFGKSGDNVPRIKKFLAESEGQVIPSLWDMADVGSNDEAKKEVSDLIGKPDVFDTPKPVRLIKRMIEVTTKKDGAAIILDFFAGSGTTAHAILDMNRMDCGDRRFILVQLPEPAGRDGHQNIAELTKERLRRAGERIRDENATTSGDIGFLVFKLDSSNIRAWEANPDDLDHTLFDSIDHIKPDRSEDDILYELLLKLGLDLCVPIERRTIAGKNIQSIGAGTLITCLDKSIRREDVETLALGIVEWHKEFTPAGDSTVVFRDSAFPDDVAKTNLAAILEQHGLGNVRSL